VSDLKDILGFEAFNLKGIAKKIKDNPLRLLYGGIDPASNKVNNVILGRDDDPLVDQWGGASADTYRKADDAGIDTKAGHNMHRAARVVASMFALGAAGRSGGFGGGGQGGGTSPGGGMDFTNMPGLPQQQEQPRSDPIEPLEVEYDGEGNPVIVSSKTKKTPGARASMAELVQRGLRGDNVIDEVGVRTGLIKEAGTELDQIEAQLDKLLSGADK